MTFLVDYVSNVWQAGSVSHVDVLRVILPPDNQYLHGANSCRRRKFNETMRHSTIFHGVLLQLTGHSLAFRGRR